MIQVGLLTQQQADSLHGVMYKPGIYFHPIEDLNGNWVLSMEEINGCDIEWVKSLPLIEFIPQETNIIL